MELEINGEHQTIDLTIATQEMAKKVADEIERKISKSFIRTLAFGKDHTWQELSLLCSFLGLSEYQKEIDNQLLTEKAKADQKNQILSEFHKIHNKDDFNLTIDNIINPSYFKKDEAYYFYGVVPTLWSDELTFQAYAQDISFFSIKKSNYFYINVGKIDPSQIVSKKMGNIDLGVTMVVVPDGMYGTCTKFKIVYLGD